MSEPEIPREVVVTPKVDAGHRAPHLHVDLRAAHLHVARRQRDARLVERAVVEVVAAVVSRHLGIRPQPGSRSGQGRWLSRP